MEQSLILPVSSGHGIPPDKAPHSPGGHSPGLWGFLGLAIPLAGDIRRNFAGMGGKIQRGVFKIAWAITMEG